MGLTVYAFIHQSDDVMIDDIAALNAELERDTGIGELVEEAVSAPGYKGFLKLKSPDELQMAILTDKEFSEYGTDYCMVYSCMDDEFFKVIATHMKAGKIVFRVETEGNETEFHVITPGVVMAKDMSDVRF